MSLPRDVQNQYYLDTDTTISIVHELEKIPLRAPSRNDSVIQPPTTADISRWQRLFGLTAAEAKEELLEHRARPIKYVPEHKSIKRWPWVQCRDTGFDLESYKYWLKMAADFTIRCPRDTADHVRQALGGFHLLTGTAVDKHVDRFQYAPEITRSQDPIAHKIYNFMGYDRAALVLRA